MILYQHLSWLFEAFFSWSLRVLSGLSKYYDGLYNTLMASNTMKVSKCILTVNGCILTVNGVIELSIYGLLI
jgi:hypothetical protein